MSRAAAVLSAGVGVLFLLRTRGSVWTRALRGTGAVVLGVATLEAVVGLGWGEVEMAGTHQGKAAQPAAHEVAGGGASDGTAHDETHDRRGRDGRERLRCRAERDHEGSELLDTNF